MELKFDGYRYHRQIVKDALKDLKEKGRVYVFNMNQVEDIIKRMPNVTYTRLEEHWYLVRRKL